jgi:4-diphosphocytidyl-2-C-methyl-D-erythritol kinase
MKIQAPAKLNLSLEVTGKRPNGYHELESDVIFLNLCDELEFETSEELIINSAIADNIILKAARRLHPTKGVRITLKKNIPMGGGLGGGSADCAATLIALNQLWQLNLPESKLYEIGLELGADVPVCLFGQLNKTSTAHFSGVGEIVTFASPRPSWYFLLVNPNKNLPTKDVFNEFELGTETPTGHKNDLEYAAIKLVPEIAHILEYLRSTKGNLFARMTGTGSTCFAVYESFEGAAKATAEVPENYWKIVAAQHSY